MSKTFNFGKALSLLKDGRPVARELWAGDGASVTLDHGSLPAGEPVPDLVDGISHKLFEIGDFGTVPRLPGMNIGGPDMPTQQWTPLISDILAEDWYDATVAKVEPAPQVPMSQAAINSVASDFRKAMGDPFWSAFDRAATATLAPQARTTIQAALEDAINTGVGVFKAEVPAKSTNQQGEAVVFDEQFGMVGVRAASSCLGTLPIGALWPAITFDGRSLFRVASADGWPRFWHLDGLGYIDALDLLTDTAAMGAFRYATGCNLTQPTHDRLVFWDADGTTYVLGKAA